MLSWIGVLGVLVGSKIPFNEMVDFIKNQWQIPSPKLYFKENGVMVFKFKSRIDHGS